MRKIGTISRGIRTPIIKANDNLEDIVVNSVLEASKSEGFEIEDRDIICITEAVVAICEGNYVTTEQVSKDIKNKFNADHIGYVFPTPVSRNRFYPYFKGIAKGAKKVTLQFAYPQDREIGNVLFPEDLLRKHNINPYTDVLNEEEFNKYYEGHIHRFTGVDYVDFFRKKAIEEGFELEMIFANDPTVILNYTKNVIVGTVRERFKHIEILKEAGAEKVLGLHEIMNESVDGSGYNPVYGLLGSNLATENTLKLFPANGQALVQNIQSKMRELTGKTVEVMVYGDGAFKDPVDGIWELADPVVSPAFTKGLEGTPNELKLKYFSDNKFADLRGEELANALKAEIKNKPESLFGNIASEGTTPRQYVDLIGSLADLTSGSGDKGTPVVYIQRYFNNYASDEE